MKQIPLLADVTSDQANSGTTETLTYDRDQASRFGVQPAAIDAVLYDAFGQREVAQYFTGNKAYYVILEALPEQFGSLSTRGKALCALLIRGGRAAVDTGASHNGSGAAAGGQPPESVSVSYGIVQPGGQCLPG